ncbi:hypothetical protein FCN77_22045 [Arthrobacter sp. 24S4-2]|uniref:YciI family protein n=1 Tax=Arthrobacter sp. 24S4-2 TaxID=2575374 RepID=UPI0010C7CA1F|nr:YciI family protein [Arthrobacter sp. 24S4-2]QCO99905.1 hypothetical protein FCN77_22045 [Arthrobacter sp. 24S4-2]
MATFAVTYAYADATAASRDEHRPRHVEFLKAQFDGGRLVRSGPFGPEEAPGALLIIKGDSKADVEALMNQDPFFINNLIEARNIRQWNIVFGADPVGADAANAVRN